METKGRHHKGRMGTIAGILEIATGTVVLIVFLYYLFSPWADSEDKIILIPLTIFGLPGATIEIVGGISSIRRSGRGWAIAGAIASMFVGVWPIGVAALVLTIVAKKEFKSSYIEDDRLKV